MKTNTVTVPVGYLRNAQGHLVPEDAVRPWDKERDRLVREIVAAAKALQRQMSVFKSRAMGDVDAFVELSAERYDVKLGGRKGNVTLMTFDGQYKVQIAISDRLVFDEGMVAAKALVDECIHEWTAGSRTEIKALVEHAFQTDKEGKINIGRILGLMRLSIDDPKWRRAMDAIKDSMQVAASTQYIRVYERQGADRYEQVALDLAAL